MARTNITVLFDHESTQARTFAMHLFETFTVDKHREGPRIPVRFVTSPTTTAALQPMGAHELFVVVVDSSMTYRFDGPERADAWAELIVALMNRYPTIGNSPHAVLPIALDETAHELDARLTSISFARPNDPAIEGLTLLTMHVAVRILQLLGGDERGDVVDEDGTPDFADVPAAPVTVFLSHAKADLRRAAKAGQVSKGPIPALIELLGTGPIKHWYDAQDLRSGAEFAPTIGEGIDRSAVLIVVLGDVWSSREWCRREVIAAKTLGRPIVVVDALADRSGRLFPYIGNAPIIRWRTAGETAAHLEPELTATWDRQDAERVILAALLEAVRFRAALPDPAENPADKAIAIAPEAMMVAGVDEATTRIWYPDPPIGNEEIELLQAVRPLEYTTPLSALANASSLHGNQVAVAVSLSAATDIEDWGASEEHLAAFADDLVLYLLLAGATIHYGGRLGYEPNPGVADSTLSDRTDFVDRLFGLVRSYRSGKRSADGDLESIHNWVGWPIWHGAEYERDNLKDYGSVARLHKIEPPHGLIAELADAAADDRLLTAGAFFAPDTADRSYAWARSMSEMRRQMVAATSCRVTLGGKLAGYVGLVPGVVEEAQLSLAAGQPVFVLGAFGGAARAFGELLRGKHRDLDADWNSDEHRRWDDLSAVYDRHGVSYNGLETVARQVIQLGNGGLAAALNNGLDEAQNLELFECSDSLRCVELILTGLRVLGESVGN